jgi:hypothetical protein
VELVLAVEVLTLVFAALTLSWIARRVIRSIIRHAVRRSSGQRGIWRRRLPRLAEADELGESRRLQRADAAARMLSHFSTAVITVGALVGTLRAVGVDLVYAISSAGFVGLAIALSGQDVIKNVLAGTVAVLEDRYGVGDEIVVRHDGTEVRGVIDLVGAASLRVRLADGGTWYGGHAKLEAVTNLSQRVATTPIEVPTHVWDLVSGDAGRRLVESSDDVGLTGVVFLPDLVGQVADDGHTTVEVLSNRPLTAAQQREVERRLTAH